jgi:hypothetical protein
MEILFKREENLFDVVNLTQVNVGDEFYYGLDMNKNQQKYQVDNIIEQRKEKGKYINENDRRFWAKINVSKLIQVK